MPASTCRPTTSATAASMRAARAAPSTGTPSSFANMLLVRSSGRGRLPVCVVRMRSVLRCTVPLLALVGEHESARGREHPAHPVDEGELAVRHLARAALAAELAGGLDDGEDPVHPGMRVRE